MIQRQFHVKERKRRHSRSLVPYLYNENYEKCAFRSLFLGVIRDYRTENSAFRSWDWKAIGSGLKKLRTTFFIPLCNEAHKHIVSLLKTAYEKRVFVVQVMKKYKQWISSIVPNTVFQRNFLSFFPPMPSLRRNTLATLGGRLDANFISSFTRETRSAKSKKNEKKN